MQHWSISSALAMEILQSYTKLPIPILLPPVINFRPGILQKRSIQHKNEVHPSILRSPHHQRHGIAWLYTISIQNAVVKDYLRWGLSKSNYWKDEGWWIEEALYNFVAIKNTLWAETNDAPIMAYCYLLIEAQWRLNAPFQYKDRLIYVWWFPC